MRARAGELHDVYAGLQKAGLAEEPTSDDAPPPLPVKPSIAVLPFDNLSGDPEQDFIGDGLSEDLITGLSRIRSFLVISRNSTFQYKGSSPDVRTVAEELGANYVIEGSVRKAGDRLRIAAQLIEGQAKLKPPESLDAWELFHRAHGLNMLRTREGLSAAQPLWEQAVRQYPEFARAHAGFGQCLSLLRLFGFGEPDAEAALADARRAVQIDNQDEYNLSILGGCLAMGGDPQSAIQHYRRAVGINPSDVYTQLMLGRALLQLGDADAALPHLMLAQELGPRDPFLGGVQSVVARAHLALKDYDTNRLNC